MLQEHMYTNTALTSCFQFSGVYIFRRRIVGSHGIPEEELDYRFLIEDSLYCFPQRLLYVTMYNRRRTRLPISPHRHQHLNTCCTLCFDNGHRNRYEMTAHCGFGLHCPDHEGWRPSFHILYIGHLSAFFGEICPQTTVELM